MKNMIFKLSIAFLILVLATCTTSTDPHREAITGSRELLQRFREVQNIPGIAVSVMLEDKLVWSEGLGYADLENRIPVLPRETRFRIGSISKSLTAAGLGVLVEQGLMDLDRPIRDYVPDVPEYNADATVRQVAGHTAGIRHYRNREFYSSRRYNTVGEGLEVFINDSLVHPSGSAYLYSSYGWNLISAAMETASGKDFLALMSEEVFVPLGMQSTVADFTDSIIGGRTRFYSVTGAGKVINAPFVDNSIKWAGGGFLSTTEDLIRFAQAHLSRRILSDSTLQTWFRSQTIHTGDETGYGIGWFVNTDGHGRSAVGHSGGSVGGRSQLLIYPGQKLIVCILTNSSDVQYGDIHYRIAGYFLNDSAVQPVTETESKAIPGQYVSGEDTVNVFLENDRFILMQAKNSLQLIRKDENLYVSTDGSAMVRFTRDDTGRMEMKFKQGRRETGLSKTGTIPSREMTIAGR